MLPAAKTSRFSLADVVPNCLDALAGRTGRLGLPPVTHAIGLGCDIAHARAIAYADGLDLESDAAVVGIGLSCRLCPRPDCRHRAHPPLEHRLLLDPSVKGEAAYRFAAQPARTP